MHRAYILYLLLLPSATLAQSWPASRRSSCAQAAAIVRSHGAVLMTTGAYTYDRFANGGDQCALGETTRPAWIATIDQMQCFGGYVCADRNRRSASEPTCFVRLIPFGNMREAEGRRQLAALYDHERLLVQAHTTALDFLVNIRA